MIVSKYQCKKCGGNDFFSKKDNVNLFANRLGIYCSKCGAWLKWGNADDRVLFENQEQPCISETTAQQKLNEVQKAIEEAVNEVKRMPGPHVNADAPNLVLGSVVGYRSYVWKDDVLKVLEHLLEKTKTE